MTSCVYHLRGGYHAFMDHLPPSSHASVGPTGACGAADYVEPKNVSSRLGVRAHPNADPTTEIIGWLYPCP